MAVIFSPLSERELNDPFRPYPKHVFVMLHDAEQATEQARQIEEVCCEELERAGFYPFKATDIPGTKDFLDKILQAIRGCGFGLIIFTKDTPASTLANIFFEAGISAILGKPVIVVKSEDATPPSDFVRTEWIQFNAKKEKTFRGKLQKYLAKMHEMADFYLETGEIALDAEELDYELAFERFKQAYLITQDKEALAKIEKIKTELDKITKTKKPVTLHERKLKKTISEFIRLAPKSSNSLRKKA